MRLIWIVAALIVLLGKSPVLDNGIDTYGNASMVDDSVCGDITWLTLEGEPYCYVSSLEGKPEISEGVAGFSFGDHYSYEIFPLEDYPGLIAVHVVSRVNLVNDYDLYAGAEATEIPAKLIYDFPCEEIWYEDIIIEINGRNFCSYGTTGTEFSVGDELFTYEGKEYFAVPGYSEWIATRNETDLDRYDLYYDIEAVTSLPVELLFETNR